MPKRHSRAGGNPEGKGRENHGNHGSTPPSFRRKPESRGTERRTPFPPLSEGELKSVQRSDVRREFPYPLKSSQAKKHDVT